MIPYLVVGSGCTPKVLFEQLSRELDLEVRPYMSTAEPNFTFRNH